MRHDERNPFSVIAHGFDIQDVGTEFDVLQRSDGIRVFVSQGAVDVSRHGEAVTPTLHVGDEVILSDDKSRALGTDVPDIALAWTSGRLVVENTSLAAFSDQLQRYSRRKIVVARMLRPRPISGTFPLTDPDGALTTAAASIGAHVIFLGPWLSIVH